MIYHNVKGQTSCGVFGIIWLNVDNKEYKYADITLQHERGHLVQEDILKDLYGPINGELMYWLKVAIPSLSNRIGADYYSYLWERGADYLGGVDPAKRRAQFVAKNLKQESDLTYISSSDSAMLYLLLPPTLADVFSPWQNTIDRYSIGEKGNNKGETIHFQPIPGGIFGDSARVEMLN